MKKFLPIISGLVLGLAMSLIALELASPAYGQDDGLGLIESAAATGDLFEWNDVFSGSSNGRDMYFLMRDKIAEGPREQALEAVAGNMGLPMQTARALAEGSVAPIFNDPQSNQRRNLNQEEAYIIYEGFRNQYEDLLELYTMQNEIEVKITPSEIFANGDLSDSGFDLIHDLELMEQLLFDEVEALTVGGIYLGSLDSPLDAEEQNRALPTPADRAPNDATNQGFPARRSLELDRASSNATRADEGNSDTTNGSQTATDSPDSTTSGVARNAVIDEDGERAIVPLEELPSDVCEVDSNYDAALDQFKEEIASQAPDEDGDGQPDEVNFATDAPYAIDPDAGGGGNANVGQEDEDADNIAFDDDGNLVPAEPGPWLKAWCPALGALGQNDRSFNSFGQYGFDSLGNVSNSLLNQAVGAETSVELPGLQAAIGICLDTEIIYGRVRSYVPGKTCIACEVDAINDQMNETLSHSLVPNKVTGNIFESAKCKNQLGGSLDFVDMNFITIAAPIQTPPNDELIFGNNVFEEWNRFIDQYSPFLGAEPTFSDEWLAQQVIRSSNDQTATTEALIGVELVKDQQTATATRDLEKTLTANVGAGILENHRVMIQEIQQMRSFFEHYNNVYGDILTQACTGLNNKETF